MKIADLNLLPDGERDRLVSLGRGEARPFPADRTIADVFCEHARRAPDTTAVLLGDTRLSYRELDDWSDRLAADLVTAHGTGPDELVALCFPRRVEMIVAVLASWKAGGAFVPIDPTTPDERVRYILEDTKARVLLCGPDQRDRAAGPAEATGTPVVVVDGPPPPGNHATAPTTGVSADDLAYVIYTSGTSGRPKGVMIENRSVVHYVCAAVARYGFGAEPGDEVILQSLNYAFDGGVVPIVLALLTGNTLLMTPDRLWSERNRYTDYLNVHAVTQINGTPTFYRQVGLDRIPTLRRMVVGGEVLDRSCFREMTRANAVPVYNEYGPTEVTISTTWHPVREFDLAIGRPHDNAWLLVLDDAMRPVPVGAVGELYLGGPGLARGYLNQPELTQARFVPNPFQTDAERADRSYCPQGINARLYRTGDLARWRADGVLDYVGRNDTQVKIRGFRVEPAEVAAVMAGYPGVGQTAVLPRESQDGAEVTSLIGYYQAPAPLPGDEYRSYLERFLPDYLVPNALIHVTALPTTANGKLDTRALRELQPDANADHVAPRNELESLLRRMVADLIGVPADRVGVCDDLFRLGLNSSLVVKLIARLEQALHIEISVASLFMYPSIAELVTSPEFAAWSRPPGGTSN